ncbi:MAG: AzlD domain-containing protein [Pseudomonadota bacterium]
MIDGLTLWTVILSLGVLSYGLRFGFLGLVGSRPLPGWLIRHLRYTAVAILPALVAPIVVYGGPDGPYDPVRIAAGAITLAVGYATKNLFAGFGAGAAALLGLGWLLA